MYLAELQRRYGWPVAMIGSATTVAFIIGAVLLPWVGAVIARCGARIVLGGGIVLIGIGVIGISRATAPWQLYGWNLLIGCGWAGASSTAISTTLAGHFDRRRGLALSLALTGASAGGFAVAPLLVALSEYAGFRAAVPEMVLGLMLPILPLIWFGLRRAAGSVCKEPDRRAVVEAAISRRPSHASRHATLRDRRFWSVAGPFALAITAQVGVMVYQVSYLLPLLGTAGTSARIDVHERRRRRRSARPRCGDR